MLPFKEQFKTWLKRRLGLPQIEFALERLAAVGFDPKLIFDVGAYQGDFASLCRRVWPDSTIACFEVQSDPLRRLQDTFARDAKVRAWPFLMGATVRENVTLHLAETGSSILEESDHPERPVAHHPMRTVDDVVRQEYGGQAPALLKLDVQGYELEVLRGAEKSLQNVRAIVMEVNLIDIYRDVPLVGEVSEWLGARHWVAYDICGLIRRPFDRALWQADMIFVPKGSPLRSDKRWN